MERYKSLIINLKIIGQIDRGTKLNTREKYLTLDSSQWSQGFKRFYRGDDRKAAYDKISDIVKELNDVVFKKNNDEDIVEFYTYIYPIVKSAIKGIESLTETYEVDKTLVSQLEVELIALKRILERIKTISKIVDTAVVDEILI